MEQNQEFTELLKEKNSIRNPFLFTEIETGLFEITSPQQYHKLYIKIIAKNPRSYLKKSDKEFLQEARKENDFAYAARGVEDAYDCALTYLAGWMYSGSADVSLYW